MAKRQPRRTQPDSDPEATVLQLKHSESEAPFTASLYPTLIDVFNEEGLDSDRCVYRCYVTSKKVKEGWYWLITGLALEEGRMTLSDGIYRIQHLDVNTLALQLMVILADAELNATAQQLANLMQGE